MISIITPTFNRGYIIGSLYESLLRQTCRDFEWIIVDDGSSDNTEEIVKSWSPFFSIRYYRVENGGKHRALNYGIPKAEGSYVFIVDSDDCLADNAVERVLFWIDSLPNDRKFAGVAGLRGWKGRTDHIGEFPSKKAYIDCKNSHRYLHHLRGDKAEVYKKDLLLANPFPAFEGEKFIGEGAVWNRLSEEGYLLRWFNEIIYYCDYLPDGLTANQENLYRQNFNGYTHNTRLNYRVLPFPYNLMAVSLYLHIANKNGISNEAAMEKIGLRTVDKVFCTIIRWMRHI